MLALYVLLALIVLFILVQALGRIIRRRFKRPAPAFAGRFFDSGFRKWMMPPGRIIEDTAIEPGMTVLEVGCGSGAYTVDAARAAGEKGKIYALDIQEDMLQQLRKKLNRPEYSDIRNIEMIHKSAYELPFPDSSIDLVFMVTVLQEIPDIQRSLAEVKRVLKPSGILSVSEFLVDIDYPWKSTTIRMVEQAGFTFNRFSGNLWTYTVRFSRAS